MSDFQKNYTGDILAESWELSCHKDGPSYIANGEYAGLTLEDYILKEGKEVLGSNAAKFQQFPVLIKFIDAAQDLSVQVHPDDSYAQEVEHQPYGKTEMWYVADCSEDAYLYFGFTKAVSAQELGQRIKENTLLEVLNKVDVKKGDTFFIEAGTIHAIGTGCLIAEIQQNSNLTYRVYDFGRKDKSGNERELHIDKALQVTNRDLLQPRSFGDHIASCEYFTVDKLVLEGNCVSGKTDGTTFVSFLILDGEGRIRAEEECVSFRKGDSIMISANTGPYTLEGSCEALVTTV